MTTTVRDDALIVIPFQITDQEYSVFVVLQAGNVERIQAYDPAEIPIAQLGSAFERLRLKDLVIGYATAEDVVHMQRSLRTEGNPMEALRYLSRGFAFRPDRGDHDRGPEQVYPL